MTQAISPPILSAQIISMHPSETIEGTPSIVVGSVMEEIAADTLLLHPDEVGEICVSLTNSSDRPLQWHISVSGTYPGAWFLEDERIFGEITSYSTIDIPLRFRVAANFLELQTALSQESPTLNLNYQTEVFVQQINPAGELAIAYKSFTLLVRPRTLYLDFLPAFYREMDFFGRFLAIFEQTFDPYIQTLDTLWAHLDPLTAPQALLPFLAHWVAWQLDPNLDVNLQRYLIRNALELYRWHGTRKGLCFYLSLYTKLREDQIQINEVFSGGFTFGRCQLGQDTMIGGGRPYHFVVNLRPDDDNPPVDESLVRRIIEHEKPPFCTYDLYIDQQG